MAGLSGASRRCVSPASPGLSASACGLEVKRYGNSSTNGRRHKPSENSETVGRLFVVTIRE